MDRRAYLKTVGAVGASAAVAGCQGGNDTITPGTASGFPPFEYTENGELVGFDVELAETVIEEAGYEVGEWVDIEFGSLTPSLTEGDIDLIAAAMTITGERDQQIDFSDAYYEANQGVLVRSGADFDPSSREDLEDSVVGAQSGTTGEQEVDKLVDDGIISEQDKQTYDNYELAVTDLKNGNIDAVIIDVPAAADFANR